MTFGEKLNRLRKESNYTQEQLADILEVSRQSVSKWESDMAYPETDKLIRLAKLFECSTDFLLKDECTSRNGESTQGVGEKTSAGQNEYPTAHQKIIGYILLAASIIAGVLIWIFAESEEDMYIPFSITLSVLTCASICLFVKQNAGYWCAWSLFAPVIVLTPHIVGLPVLSSATIVQFIFVISMAIVANKCFSGVAVVTSSRKSLVVVCGWFALIGLRIYLYVSVISSVIGSAIAVAPYVAMEMTVYIGTALLLTYTVCYIKNLRKTNINGKGELQ